METDSRPLSPEHDDVLLTDEDVADQQQTSRLVIPSPVVAQQSLRSHPSFRSSITDTLTHDHSDEQYVLNDMCSDKLNTTPYDTLIKDNNKTRSRKSQKPYPPQIDLWKSINLSTARLWQWEVLAGAGSLIAIIALAALLKHFDGQPQPQWQDNININTVVSIFTTVIKTFILYIICACIGQSKWISCQTTSLSVWNFVVHEEASRGPWGAVVLLCRANGKLIAGLGASLMIFAIAIDPTMQQMVTIDSKMANVSTTIALDRAQTFFEDDAPHASYDPDSRSTSMIGEIYFGMFFGAAEAATGGTLDMPVFCSTGNCTFPTFQSLAVCSKCQDASDNLTKTCYEEFCELSLPNGLRLNVTSADNELHAQPYTSSGWLLPIYREPTASDILVFSQIHGNQDQSSISGQADSSLDGSMAMECILTWCVNTYDSNVQNGILNETIVSSWSNPNATWWPISSPKSQQKLDLVVPERAQYFSGNPNYTITYQAISGLSEWLANKTTMSFSMVQRYVNGNLSWTPDDDISTKSSSLDLLPLLRDEPAKATFANLAQSMTRHVRGVSYVQQSEQGSVGGVGPVHGQAQASVVVINIRWPWLTYTVVLILLTLLLLTLTIFSTVNNEFSTYKSSPLPLVYHALHQTPPDQSPDCLVKDIAMMEKLTDNIDMRLQMSETGPRLIKGDSKWLF